MRRLNVVWMVVPPRPSHSFRVPVVRHDIAVIREFLMANCAYPVLLNNFAIEKLAHFGGRAEFAVSSRMMRVFDAPNARLQSSLLSHLLPTTAEQGAVNRAGLVATEFHGGPPVELLKLR